MWADEALPRLRDRGLGLVGASRTLRLAGIGESQVAAELGEAILRAADPVVATYARSDAVDVRISARGAGADGSSPAARVEAMAERVAATLAGHVWSEGSTSWADAIGDALAPARGSLAVVEVGTAGSLATLLGDRDWLTFTEALGAGTATARSHGTNDGLEHLARPRSRDRRGDAWRRGPGAPAGRGHGGGRRRRRAGLGPPRAAGRVPRWGDRSQPRRARGGPRRADGDPGSRDRLIGAIGAGAAEPAARRAGGPVGPS